MRSLLILLCFVVAVAFAEEVQKPPITGSDPCTWGPGFWCRSYENAQRCNGFAHCNSVYWQTAEAQKPPGRDPCTRGPSFWCKNLQNVKRCMAVAYCNSVGSSFMHMSSPSSDGP